MMNAKCGQCGTEIRLDESKLGERGARVRCPRCSSTVVIERASGGTELLDIDFGSGVHPQELDPKAFDATAVAAPALDRAPVRHAPGGKPDPARGAPAARPAPPAPAPAAPADEPELLGDEDLELADADEVTDASGPPAASAPPRAAPPPTAIRAAPGGTVPALVTGTIHPSKSPPAGREVAPKPYVADAATRVAAAPNLTRPPAPPARPPSVLDAAERTATGVPGLDDADEPLMMGGALSPDGKVIAPKAPPAHPAPPPSAGAEAPGVETRRVSLAYDALATTTQARIADAGRPRRPGTPARSALRIVAAVAGALAAVALLFFGLIVFLSGGRIDERVLRLDHEALASLWSSRPIVVLDGVKVTAMRSSFYPTRTGEQALVFEGEVTNLGAEARQRVQVTAEVRDQGGRLLASARAPVGVALVPPDLWASDDPAALERAYRPAPAAAPPDTVPPGATVPFTVVISRPPPQAEHQKLVVSLGYADPPRVEAPPPAPAEPEPAPARSKGKPRLKGKTPKP